MAYKILTKDHIVAILMALAPRFVGRDQDHLLGLADEAAWAAYDRAYDAIEPLQEFDQLLQGPAGASVIGITDLGEYYSGTTIEQALEQVGAFIDEGPYIPEADGPFIPVSDGPFIHESEKAVPNGVATLGLDGKVEPAQLPPAPADAVTSVFGRVGNIVAETGDYSWSQIADKPVFGSAAFVDTTAFDPSGSAATAQSFSIQRSNHTGTQLANTISDFDAAASAAASTLITQSIVNGDTTHSPSGDVVFDSLASKVNVTSANIQGSLVVNGTSSVPPIIDLNSMNNVHGWRFIANINDVNDFGFQLRTIDTTTHFQFRQTYFLPSPDNTKVLGNGSNRWSTVYAATGSINTSDAREKDNIRELNEAELAAAIDLAEAARIYQWKEALAEKGDSARLHCSPTVQNVISIMESHGLDPFRYGFVCYDQWDAASEIYDPDTGELMQPAISAGDRYSLRSSELQSFISAGLASQLRKILKKDTLSEEIRPDGR